VKKRFSYKFVSFFILFSFIVILSGKILFGAKPGSIILYVYGLFVTVIISIVFYIALFKYKDPYEAAEKSLMDGEIAGNPLVSLMVAVKDEKEKIKDCIDSLIRQDYQNKEIIIVDDGSVDGTKDILESYRSTGKIKLINLKKNIGKKKALGKAMLKAKGEIFAFTDSDSVLALDAISKTVKILDHDPEVGAISGHCRALNAEQNLLTRIQDSWYEGQFSIRKAFESHFGAVTCVSGPLAVFRKEAIFNYIPAWEKDSFLGQEFRFATDRTLTGFVLGSLEIGKKLKDKYKQSAFVKRIDYPEKRWKVVYSAAAKSWTTVPDNFRRFLRQQIRWKKSFLRNIFFTGRFYWNRPFIPAFIYYFHIIFVFAAPFIIFRHLIYIPIFGDFSAILLYLSGIIFIGFLFSYAYRLKNQDKYATPRWIYRPMMSIMSTLFLSWLIFYSIVTIKRTSWRRD